MSDRTDRLRELAAKIPEPSDRHGQEAALEDVFTLVAAAWPDDGTDEEVTAAIAEATEKAGTLTAPLIMLVNPIRCPDLSLGEAAEFIRLAREEFS